MTINQALQVTAAIEKLDATEEDAYTIFSEVLDFPDQEQRRWWHSTAPMFSKLLRENKYNIHDQYKYLYLHIKYFIPFLGHYPTNDKPRWLSVLTRYGAPFEFSLNCSQSIVRFAFEPINSITGTASDPFNTLSIWEFLGKLRELPGGVNLEGLEHFKRHLTVDGSESTLIAERGLSTGKIKTQNLLAFDLKDGKLHPKVYFYPELKSIATGRSVQQLTTDSIRALPQLGPLIPSLCVLEDYLLSRGVDSTASIRLFSCDVTDLGRARIKIYILERAVSATTVEDLWTLGGRRKSTVTQKELDDLLELWDILHIPAEHREYPEPYLALGATPDEALPLMVNFTLELDGLPPTPQIYIPTFGMKDADVVDALTTFFDRKGWTQKARSYKENLQSYFPTKNIDQTNHIQSYISFSHKKGTPYLSVYLESMETNESRA